MTRAGAPFAGRDHRAWTIEARWRRAPGNGALEQFWIVVESEPRPRPARVESAQPSS